MMPLFCLMGGDATCRIYTIRTPTVRGSRSNSGSRQSDSRIVRCYRCFLQITDYCGHLELLAEAVRFCAGGGMLFEIVALQSS